jgi:hypothetical protein
VSIAGVGASELTAQLVGDEVGALSITEIVGDCGGACISCWCWDIRNDH